MNPEGQGGEGDTIVKPSAPSREEAEIPKSNSMFRFSFFKPASKSGPDIEPIIPHHLLLKVK